ncbi:hypothetical protein BS78_03G359800 [Paspalum vaginatum]|nr:hypothetical protein BS78_03G359800 [Paspalum vaginatum]
MVEGSSEASAGSRSPLGMMPVLVYDHGLEPNRQTAFAIGDQSLHTSVVPELMDNYYHVTAHGWVLLVAPGPSPGTRLWDPRSGDSVALPAMESEPPEVWECYLSDKPTSPSCLVLVLDIKNPRFLYCRVGDSRLVIQHTAAVGGKFYFEETGKLGCIDFSPATPEFSFVSYPCPELPDGSTCGREYLVESRGELFNVAFLLSHANYRLLCSASKYGVKGNCVYFNLNVMGEKDGGLAYIYDSDDQSLKSVRPCPEMTELYRNPFWMLPTDQDT